MNTSSLPGVFTHFSAWVVMRSLVTGLVGFLLLTILSVWADFQKPEWQFLKTLETTALKNEGYVRVTVDGEVYGQSQVTLADLRLIDEQQREIPYALLEPRSITTEEEYSPKMFNQAALPGAYSTFSLDLGKTLYHNKLVIETSSKNFKRRVEVAGSSDARRWLVLRDNAYIFDFSGDQKVQLTRVTYPECNYRYLQVKVWNGSEKPLQLESAGVFFEKTETPQRSVRASRLFSREEDPKLKATVCILDLAFANLPSDLLTLETPEENFSRLVEIQGSNDLKDWQRHLQSEFYRFKTSKFDVEKKTFQFPEARHRYLKIVIYNYDDPPLRLGKLEVQGIEKDLIFQSQAQRQLSLYYGNQRAKAPRYDVERVKNFLSLQELPTVRLGGETRNPQYVPYSPRLPWTEAHPVLFWGILVLLVVSLGAYILRLMARVKTA